MCVTAMRRTVPERAKGMRGIECFVQCKKGFSLFVCIYRGRQIGNLEWMGLAEIITG